MYACVRLLHIITVHDFLSGFSVLYIQHYALTTSPSQGLRRLTLEIQVQGDVHTACICISGFLVHTEFKQHSRGKKIVINRRFTASGLISSSVQSTLTREDIGNFLNASTTMCRKSKFLLRQKLAINFHRRYRHFSSLFTPSSVIIHGVYRLHGS